MIFRESELKIVDFGVLEFNYQFIVRPASRDEDRIMSSEVFQDYEIYVDFDINVLDGLLRVFMTIEVNPSKKHDGYYLRTRAAGLFQISEAATEETKSNLSTSAVSITLNNIRAFLSTFTSQCPPGRYILPSVDLQDLIVQYVEKIEAEINLKKPENKTLKRKSSETRKGGKHGA